MTQLSKSNAREVANARTHLRLGNPGAYARSMSGLHRAATRPQQPLIWAEVLRDEMQHHFTRIHDGSTLLAIEPAQDDPELVEVGVHPLFADILIAHGCPPSMEMGK